jgi:hypothetical protein
MPAAALGKAVKTLEANALVLGISKSNREYERALSRFLPSGVVLWIGGHSLDPSTEKWKCEVYYLDTLESFDRALRSRYAD